MLMTHFTLTAFPRVTEKRVASRVTVTADLFMSTLIWKVPEHQPRGNRVDKPQCGHPAEYHTATHRTTAVCGRKLALAKGPPHHREFQNVVKLW